MITSRCRLGDPGIATIISGQSPPSSTYNDLRHGTAFFQGNADFGDLHPVPRVWATEGPKRAMARDVLVSVRAPVGAVNMANSDCVIGRGLAAVRAGVGADPWFLFFALRFLRPELENRASGSTFASISTSTLASLEVPAFDVLEQANMGRALLLVAENAHREAGAIEAAIELKRATMKALFTLGLRGKSQKQSEVGPIPQDWTVELLSARHAISSGGTPSRSRPDYWESGTIPWVKTAEVNYSVISDTEERITPLAIKETSAKIVPKGALLMAMYGQGVTRGKVAILGIDAACNQACAAILVKREGILTEYLYHYLTSRYDAIRAFAHGGQQQNLSLEIVKELSVAFPADLEEQREIVTILEHLDRKISLHRRKRVVLDELFKSLLHRLMTGEIRVADLNLDALAGHPATESAAS